MKITAAMSQKFFSLKTLIIVFTSLIAIYTLSWFGTAKNIKRSLENLKTESEGVLSYDHEVYGFPFNMDIKLTNFVIKLPESIEGKADAGEQLIITTNGEWIIESNFFGNKADIYLPEITTLNYGGGDVINCKYISPASFEVTYGIGKLKMLFASFGLGKITYDDISHIGLTYNDDGAIYYDNNNREYGRYAGMDVEFALDKKKPDLNMAVKFNYRDLLFNDAYYEFYRKILLKGSENNDYEMKLADYLINFSKYAGKTSFMLDASMVTNGAAKSLGKASDMKLKLNDFLISDKLGNTKLDGVLNVKRSPDGVGDEIDFDINYRMDNYKKIFEKYIAFFSDTLTLFSHRSFIGKSEAGQVLDKANINKNILRSLSASIKSSLYDFFGKINAVDGNRLKIRAVLQPGQPIPMPSVNGIDAMQLMQIAQTSFMPVMQKMGGVEPNKKRYKRKAGNSTR